ncbi:hypothetical protein [Streptomyces sp. NPDC050264]|uniref:hypothetical protein n=1 Tax=Streptomyces sp. NPDC050264 TaxID=3155038 RepID=UPI003412603C
MHTSASAVADFVTEQVPQPRSALVLACLLQLTETSDGARSWWEYAAGAGTTVDLGRQLVCQELRRSADPSNSHPSASGWKSLSVIQ